MKLRPLLLVAAAVAALALAVSPADAAKKTKCSGTATIDQVALALGAGGNQIDVDFKCNKGFKKFKVSANKTIQAGFANGGFDCKKDGKRAEKCTATGNHKVKAHESEQATFNTKASDPCAGKALKVKVTAAGKTFTLKGPC